MVSFLDVESLAGHFDVSSLSVIAHCYQLSFVLLCFIHYGGASQELISDGFSCDVDLKLASIVFR